MAEQMPYVRKEDSLPAVLTPDEFLGLLRVAWNVKIRTASNTIYAARPRVSEIVSLRDVNRRPNGTSPESGLSD